MNAHMLGYRDIQNLKRSRADRFRDWFWSHQDDVYAMSASSIVGLLLGAAFIASILIHY